MGDLKETFGKIWYFIWEDNSIWSWIVNVLLAFVLIKFIVYPGLGFAFQTSHPIVAVMSESMEHDGSFNMWWESMTARCSDKRACTQEQFYSEYGISKSEFIGFKLHNGFNIADIITIKGVDIDDINIGDVIVYWGSEPIPIIHRVVDKFEEDAKQYVSTKGDHNSNLNFNEKKISEERIVGKAVFKIPYLGWIKIGFVRFLEALGII